MADSVPYPGSPSLAPEAREKVLQTYRHTLELARGGRNDEALLGCDFILKMDPRFAPAKRLLESLRGASAGTVLDLSAHEAAVSPAATAPRVPSSAQTSGPFGTGPATASRQGPAPVPAAPADDRDSFLPSAAGPGADPFDFGSSPDPFGSFSPSGPFAAAPATTAATLAASSTSASATAPTPAFGSPKAVPAAPLSAASLSAVPLARSQPVPSAPIGGGLDDLAFDQPLEFGFPPAAPAVEDPFGSFAASGAASAAPPAAAAAAAAPVPPPPPASFSDNEPTSASFLSPHDPFATPHEGFPGLEAPAFPPASAAPAQDPFGSSDPFDAQPPGAFPPAAPEPPFPSFSAPPSSPPLAAGGPIPLGPAPAAGPDPRIGQFLKQGDEAMSRGQVQEAIDLWSRVFLIDLSNDDASHRIDSAREKQTQMAQAIDVLVSEGIALFDRGDLISARSKFLDVLAIQEGESTARSYLNQIDAALAQQQPPGAAAFREPSEAVFVRDRQGNPLETDRGRTASGSFGGPDSPFLSQGESAGLAGTGGAGSPEGYGATAQDRLPSTEVPAFPERKKAHIDGRILLGAAAALLVAIAGGSYFLLRGRATPPPPPPGSTAGKPKPAAPAPAGDPLEKATALFQQGKADEALQLLVAVREGDPRHADALVLIEKIKSSPVPAPPTPPPSAAALDELRVQGLAAVRSSRYIEGVKALDPVVKARPDDSESAQALVKAREQLAALSSAIRAFNEGDYESATKMLWELRKKDPRNLDVEEYLFKSYYNDGIVALQSGNTKRAREAFGEASQLRPGDAEAQRHVKFVRKYPTGPTDLMSRIYVKNAGPRT